LQKNSNDIFELHADKLRNIVFQMVSYTKEYADTNMYDYIKSLKVLNIEGANHLAENVLLFPLKYIHILKKFDPNIVAIRLVFDYDEGLKTRWIFLENILGNLNYIEFCDNVFQPSIVSALNDILNNQEYQELALYQKFKEL